MNFNKINYYDKAPKLTYDACQKIWDNRGYLPKAAQTKPKERIGYRRLWSDTTLFYDESTQAFQVKWTGWSNRCRENAVLLLTIHKDNRTIINNILKFYYDTEENVRKIHGTWGLNRYLDRIQYLTGLGYIYRKCTKGSLYQAVISPLVVFTNQKDSCDGALMSDSAVEQAKALRSYSCYWAGKEGNNYSEFIRSSSGSSNSNYSSAEAYKLNYSRMSVLQKYLVSQYVIGYVESIALSKPNSSLVYARVVRDFSDLTVTSTQDTGTSRESHFSHKDIAITDKDVTQIDRDAVWQSEFCSKYKHSTQRLTMFGATSAIASAYSNQRGTKSLLQYTPLGSCFGFHIDAGEVGGKLNIKNRINSKNIRSMLSHLHVNPLVGANHTIPGHMNVYVGESYRGPYNHSLEGQASKNLTNHMLQLSLSRTSPMWSPEFNALTYPMGILIYAALVKAGAHHGSEDFILRQYLGSKAVDWLLARKECLFTRQATAEWANENNRGEKKRNLLKDYIGLISGFSELYCFDSSKTSFQTAAINSYSGFRLNTDGGAYVDLIPIYLFGGDSCNYTDAYMDGLYSISRLLSSQSFCEKVMKHVQSEFITSEREHKYIERDRWAKIKQSTFKYTDLLYNYLRNLQNNTDGYCSLSKEILIGSVRVMARRSTENISYCDLSLASNLKETFVNSSERMTGEAITDVLFAKELQESLSL